ncbi:MAG: hypothetical protein KME59_16655 [Trichormus sp. ATA11-4-KO1]|nr:hypothetical protein [Trichormus sp. ATA11-4-KO1]
MPSQKRHERSRFYNERLKCRLICPNFFLQVLDMTPVEAAIVLRVKYWGVAKW